MTGLKVTPRPIYFKMQIYLYQFTRILCEMKRKSLFALKIFNVKFKMYIKQRENLQSKSC